MIYCFDTSAINELHDDGERKSIIDGLRGTNSFRVTGLNVIEVCGTRDANRRLSLLKLLKHLTGDCVPLAPPNDLLRHLAQVHASGDQSAHVTISAGQEYFHVLQQPEEVGDEIRERVLSWQRELEKPFTEIHRKARTAMQCLFVQKPGERPATASALIRSYCKNDEALHDYMAGLYRGVTQKELLQRDLRELLSQFPQWSLYLFGWAYSAFQRAIQKQGFGTKKGPGTIDLWCAVYLPHCDYFVTADRSQYRALRLANALNGSRHTRILLYKQLRRRLIVVETRS